MIIEAVACQNKNINERLNSSSGGVFSLLAKETISMGGVVFGAAFNKDFMVEHIEVNSEDRLCNLQGSKYCASNIGNSYILCLEELNKGKDVLFSGTPCQIAGLLAYLKVPYDNLITIDCVCHGAPEASEWKQYLKELADGRKVVSVNFRDKRSGWETYHFTVKFDDDSEYSVIHNEDLYMKAFIGNLILRSACSNCMFKGLERQADITLGDLWGASEISPSLYDKKGTSLVLINSDKGRRLFDNIRNKVDIEQIDLLKAIEKNPSIVKESKPSVYKKMYKKGIKKQRMMDVLRRIYKPTFPQKVINKLYMVFGLLKSVRK